MKYLIFDFNGTIVNDLDLSLESINYCRKKYIGLGPLSKEEYRDIFTFPVKDYYVKAGFDFNIQDWDEVANCWMEHYLKHHHECKLFDGITDLVNKAHSKGYKCVVISASEEKILKQQLIEFGIYDIFDDIIGLTDIFAVSKIESALNYFKGQDISDSILIGDTDHDKETADSIGCKCILVASGHESFDRLKKVNDIVYNSIKEVEL